MWQCYFTSDTFRRGQTQTDAVPRGRSVSPNLGHCISNLHERFLELIYEYVYEDEMRLLLWVKMNTL